MDDCPFCEGSGEVAVLPLPRDPAYIETRECSACEGTGTSRIGVEPR